MKPLLATYNRSSGTWSFHQEAIRDFDLVERQLPTLSTVTGRLWPGHIESLEDERLLDLTDWLAHRVPGTVTRELEGILQKSSSAWMVGQRNENVGLVRRIEQSVEIAAQEAISLGSAGALLGEAWAACFGRTANPEEAYGKAIKAVEEAASPVISPKNTRATLGTMVRDMRNQGDWKIDLPGAEQGVVVNMMEALWTGQESRHGGNGYRIPTHSEAETSVLLAVPLVQWFATRAVARRP